MLGLIDKLLANDKVRYVIAGGCTTFVNLISFFLLRSLTSISRNTCNVIAIALAITFAYFANKYFVFRSKTDGWFKTLSEMLSFVGARLVSMGVEVLGFAILCDSFRLNEVYSKLFVQFLVLVLNYVFSNLFVFKSGRKSFKENVTENYCYYISFIVVLIFMVAICVAEQIVPFGGNSLTIVDSTHQYLPFMADLRGKLLEEGSLFYSWNIAMGSNFMSLSAYYLSSPFNYIILFFSKENIVFVANLIIVLKICLSALTMAYYLSNKGGEKKKDAHIIAMAVAYALSNYVVGYCWNMMWMDCILMFPLLMLGFERLMRDRDPKLYVLALFYCLYCNYYIGFMICIFMVLWFFVYSHPGIKAFFMNGIRFAVCSLLGGGMAMFALIPAYFGIMATASGEMKLPKWQWYGSIFDILKQQMFLTESITNQTFDGGANLYCGMFAVFAFFLYVTRIWEKPFEKIRKVLLLALLIISCNNELLNYIWHGFHNQYGIPNRFTFLIIFILLDIGYDILSNIKDIKQVQIFIAWIFSATYLVLCWKEAKADTKLVVASLIVVLIYAAWCCLRTGKRVKEWLFSFVFTLICCIEIIINATFGFFENGHAVMAGKYDDTKAISAAFDEVKHMAEADNAGFYRVELVDSTVLDEVTWHRLPSVGTFCSTVLGDMVTTMGRLGFYTGANEFLYMGYTPFTNSIFNVRYVLGREGDYNNFDFNYVKTVDGIQIFENPYPLSIGFCVDESYMEWSTDSYRYERAQNKLSRAMSGYGDFFEIINPDLIVDSDSGELFLSGRNVKFTPESSGEGSFIASFYVEEAGDYYLNCRGSSLTKIRFYVNSEELTFDRYQSQLFHLGQLNVDDYVSVEFYYRSVNAGQEYSASMTTSIFDMNKFERAYEKLNNNMLEVTEYDDGYIKGKVNVMPQQVLFTSVPYDEGWKVLVDGKETEYKKGCGSFIAIPLEAGEHSIEMIYMPKGLKAGILISVASVLIFVAIICAQKRKKDVQIVEENSNNDIDRNLNI